METNKTFCESETVYINRGRLRFDHSTYSAAEALRSENNEKV